MFYVNQHPHPEVETQYGVCRVMLDALLAKADSICLQVSLTPETRHLTDAAELAKVKRSATLINVSHGVVVDEAAPTDVLCNGTIYGMGLDMFKHESLSVNPPLLAMNNVVALPHIDSATYEVRYATVHCAVDNLIKALVGTLCESLVNP